MKEVKVNQVYGISNISATNDIWLKMMKDYLTTDEPVLFDFERVTLNAPWKNKVFNKFIADPRVHMRVYTASKVKDTIDSMLLMINGKVTKSRVENIDIVVENPNTYSKRQVKMLSERLAPAVTFVPAHDKDPDSLELVLAGKVSQIGSVETVQAIKETLCNARKDYPNVKLFKVNTDGVIIQSNMYDPLASMEKDDEFKGCTVDYLDSNIEKIKRITTYKEVGDNYRRLTKEQKLAAINQEVHPGSVVMLNLMRPTKARNEFGQMNGGEYRISRAAIYKGAEKSANEVYLNFTSFKKETFMTRRHWYLEHDMEEMPNDGRMNTQDHRIEINNIGYSSLYGTSFTGAEAQFNLPVQLDARGYKVTYSPSVPGVKVITVTLPEYIKITLDDHNVNYDSASLMNCIRITNRYLKKNGITPDMAKSAKGSKGQSKTSKGQAKTKSSGKAK